MKEMYPSTSKYARRGVGNTGGCAEPDRPTHAAPGTPEKEAVLAERAAAGLSLWHPFDARYLGDPRPVRFRVPAREPLDQLAITIVEGLIVSEKAVYARPLANRDDARERGRDVMLVVPGHLVYLTPAEARLLAGQLQRAADEREAASAEDGGE